MIFYRTIVLSGICAVAIGGCKTQDSTSGAQDILGAEEPTWEPQRQESPLKTKALRTVYKESGFAGPTVTIFDRDDPQAVRAGRTLAISTNCNAQRAKITCSSDEWTFELLPADKKATFKSQSLGVNKNLECTTFSAQGMTPTTGYDCKEVDGESGNEADASAGNAENPGSALAPGQVKCTLTTDNGTEWVKLTVGADGKIAQKNEKRWADVSRSSYWLSIFKEDIEEYGIEWSNSFRARNGFSILELGTTADAFSVGVNMSTGKGFFTYKDHGSGSGNFGPVDMSCAN